MGSSPPPDLVSRSALARTMGVTTRTVSNWIRDGLIEPVYVGALVYFRAGDVEALQESVAAKDTDLATLARQARQAYAASVRAERRIEELMELLGLNRPELPLDEASVEENFVNARHALGSLAIATPQVVRYWASVFFGMDEEYIALLHKVRSHEPWTVYLDLGEKLSKDLGIESATVERHNFAYLSSARDKLRQVTYFYLGRRRGGGRSSVRVSPAGEGMTDRMLSLMYLP